MNFDLRYQELTVVKQANCCRHILPVLSLLSTRICYCLLLTSCSTFIIVFHISFFSRLNVVYVKQIFLQEPNCLNI